MSFDRKLNVMSLTTLRVAGCWIVPLLLAACGKLDSQPTSTSQVAATVNGRDISIHQIQAVVEMQPHLLQQYGANASSKVLDSLVEQEMAAQAAESAGLHQTPKVVQALALSHREVLARAYQDHLASKVPMPDDTDVEQYYKEHPELFSERKLFELQETVIRAAPQAWQALPKQVEAATSMSTVNDMLQKAALPYSARHTQQWAEAVPMDLLRRLVALNPGQSIWVPRADGATVLTLLSEQEVPLSLAQAKPSIREALWAMRKKAEVQKGMQALREQTKVVKQADVAASDSVSGKR